MSQQPLDDDQVDAVLHASQALVALSARSIAPTGVTLPQFRMLVVLHGGPCILSTLADQLDVAPSTAMRMVDRLVAAGLVERSTPEQDRRVRRLALTEQGSRVVRRAWQRRRRDLQAVLNRMPATQRRELAGVLAAFAAAAEDAWKTPIPREA